MFGGLTPTCNPTTAPLSLWFLTGPTSGATSSVRAIVAVEVREDAVNQGGELIHVFVRQVIEEVAAGGRHVSGRGACDCGAAAVGHTDHGPSCVLRALLAYHEAPLLHPAQLMGDD